MGWSGSSGRPVAQALPLKDNPGVAPVLIIFHYQPMSPDHVEINGVKLTGVASMPLVNNSLAVNIDPNSIIGPGLEAIAPIAKI